MKKLASIACCLLPLLGFSQTLPYKNPQISVEERVKDLLSRMTPEEKFWQLFMIPGQLDPGVESKYEHGIFGFQVSAASATGEASGQMLRYGTGEDPLALVKKINAMQRYFVEKTRLGIPIIAFDEALHGLVRDGATSFPQAIGLAATWDTVLVGKVAQAIATETRIRGIRQILSPVVNIASDVRWGRVEETYGEDPFLTSEIGVSFVRPFEKIGIVTTPKHFVVNSGDGGRDSYPILYSTRLLEEVYLPPFKALITRGGSRSIMTAYNSLDGIPCSANPWLLNTKLKKEWGFKGFVISDAGGVGGANVLHFTARDYLDAGRLAVSNGLDVLFQTDYDHYRLFIPPFLDGTIDPKTIDESVSRVLRIKFELGLFENPYASETELLKWTGDKTHKMLAREAANKSIVLLKNEKNILPISKSVRSIAVIGQDAADARPGGYSGPGNGRVSILEGIKTHDTALEVNYASGCGIETEEWGVVPGKYLSSGESKNGLKGEYYNNITLSGMPSVTRIDPGINFHWTLFSPDPSLPSDFFSARWTGSLRAPRSGKFKIGLEGNDGYRLYLNGRLLIDNWRKESYRTEMTEVSFQENKTYDLRIEFFEPNGNAHVKLVWNVGVKDDWKKSIREAVSVARKADVAVVVCGIREGEFQDRAYLNLPGHQEEMIRQVAATGKPVVVVLVGGSAITMGSWLSKVNGVIDVWYPGEEGGHAVANVLFGDYNPAGRLPLRSRWRKHNSL